ncbi:hypothetical protein Zmor_005426 [Zophobas morio]|uniref:Uncharacterized protein n=1 Tax=Zophobas morio TaxID=2755281 RepID=A0AA38IW04_9CUCU|nr:hypothetical protein Zmor_005426 [Zophobas morio]
MSTEKNLTGMEQCTPPELREAAKNLEEKLLPEKSRTVYLKMYAEYKDWCAKKEVAGTSEDVLLVYFEEQSKKKKPSTLWSVYSMLRSTISLKEDIDISKYYKLVAFIKRQNAAYKPKKSSVFSRAEITKFLLEAPDNDFLSTKAIFITGLAGACRPEELCNMHMKDITIQDDIIIVNIPHTKNATSSKFVITELLWIKIVKKYFTNRPSPDMPKVLIGFRGGKPMWGDRDLSRLPFAIYASRLLLAIRRSLSMSHHRRTNQTALGGLKASYRGGVWFYFLTIL